MLKGKPIVLGVTGGIAAYKSAMLSSLLVKAGATVQVIMTKNAQEFIAPLTFEALTNQRCLTDTFDRNHEYSTEHVALAKRADAFIIAPATANAATTMIKIKVAIKVFILISRFLVKKIHSQAYSKNDYNIFPNFFNNFSYFFHIEGL